MSSRPSRVERVLNLLALLLETRVPLRQEDIVREVMGYPEGKNAYRRTFERDKEMLRALGVPVTLETLANGVETGYRVRPEDYYLPDLGLTEEETAALRVAVSAVSLGDQSGRGALWKLGSGEAGNNTPLASLPFVPALAELFEATRQHAVANFVYRGAPRRVQPYGIISRGGRWYLVAHDLDRGETRSFRADRVDGEVSQEDPGTFVVPEGFRPEDHVETRPFALGEGEPFTVRLRLDVDHIGEAQSVLGTQARFLERPEGIEVEFQARNRAAVRSFVLGFLDHAQLLEPSDLREDIMEWLTRIQKTR